MVSFGSPLASPAFQQMRTYLILARDLPGRGTGVESTHGSNFEITTVDASGQIHFLAPFNVFVPLTSCLIFGVHSTTDLLSHFRFGLMAHVEARRNRFVLPL